MDEPRDDAFVRGMQRAVDFADRAPGTPGGSWTGDTSFALYHAFRGEEEAVLGSLDDLLADEERNGADKADSEYLLRAATALVRVDRADRARTLIDEALDTYERTLGFEEPSVRLHLGRFLDAFAVAGIASGASAQDGVDLRVDPGAVPTELSLSWTGGQPTFGIFRTATPENVLDPANKIGETSGNGFTDTPPPGTLWFYVVTSPCVSDPPEVCDGVDNDCNGVVDDPGAESSCNLANAAPACIAGACEVLACDADFWDANGDPADGCIFQSAFDEPDNTRTDENCDDGGTLDGDGCNATCRVEKGWLCDAGRAECVRIGRVVVSHSGNTNPATEGWTQQDSHPGVLQGTVTGDRGLDAWFIDDDSTARASRTYYTFTPDPADVAAGDVDGWALRVRVRVVDVPDDPDFSVYSEYSNGVTRWGFGLGSAVDGDVLVRLFGDATTVTLEQLDDGYHLLELIFDPEAGHADLYVDGVEVLSNNIGEPLALTRVVWGANQSASTGRGNYNMIEWVVLECGDGVVGPDEACDDGNVVDGDGCSRLCRVE